jgi:hypothetical protein
MTAFASGLVEALGWLAALCTLLTFACRDARRLRLLALAANASFIAYGLLASLWPVLALHLALVPINALRLLEVQRMASRKIGSEANQVGFGEDRVVQKQRRHGCAKAEPGSGATRRESPDFEKAVRVRNARCWLGNRSVRRSLRRSSTRHASTEA